jgi:hypothetical protein
MQPIERNYQGAQDSEVERQPRPACSRGGAIAAGIEQEECRLGEIKQELTRWRRIAVFERRQNWPEL